MELQGLPNEINELVEKLKSEGDNLQMGHKNLHAIKKFKQAYELLSEPKNQWVYGSILAADIAQNYYLHAVYDSKSVGEKNNYLLKAVLSPCRSWRIIFGATVNIAARRKTKKQDIHLQKIPGHSRKRINRGSAG